MNYRKLFTEKEAAEISTMCRRITLSGNGVRSGLETITGNGDVDAELDLVFISGDKHRTLFPEHHGVEEIFAELRRLMEKLGLSD